ncbi:LysM peptidoglycan-binding domain-containing protein [Aerococcaceae bacterium WGS1372]
MSHKSNRKFTLTVALAASMMTVGLGRVAAQDFVRPEPGDAAYLPGYSLVERYFPTVDAAVKYGRANFNYNIHENFHVTMDEHGAYLYYELLDSSEAPEEPEVPSDNIYVVQSGDYLYKIANQFGVTVQDLIDWNNLDSNYLYVGQKLVVVDPSGEVPEEPKEPEEPEVPSDNIYVVQSGDYLYKIANQFGVTVQDLIDWNNLDSNYLYVGQKLVVVDPSGEVPEEPKEPEEPEVPSDNIYVVQAGDYLYKIANQFGVTVQDLIDWNNLESDFLQIGDELIIRES